MLVCVRGVAHRRRNAAVTEPRLHVTHIASCIERLVCASVAARACWPKARIGHVPRIGAEQLVGRAREDCRDEPTPPSGYGTAPVKRCVSRGALVGATRADAVSDHATGDTAPVLTSASAAPSPPPARRSRTCSGAARRSAQSRPAGRRRAVEPVVGVGRHLQHGHAVAGRRARDAGQHLALEYARPATPARSLASVWFDA